MSTLTPARLTPLALTLPLAYPGFVPVVTTRFPLDAALRGVIEANAGAALISVPELLTGSTAPLPRVPLLIDSGGYAALHPQARVTDQGGLGALHLPDGRVLTPELVWDTQVRHGAALAFTLDFPAPAGLPDADRARRHQLGLRNAKWALARERPFRLYVSIQPGTDSDDMLDLIDRAPDGLALGGLAPFSRQHDVLTREITRVRALMPHWMPLHVFGLGHPDSVRAALQAGATSVDSSSPQRTAASGRTYCGTRVDDPSPAERVQLAATNLKASLRAGRGEEAPFQAEQIVTPPGEHPAGHALARHLHSTNMHQLITWTTAGGKTSYAHRQAGFTLQTPGAKVLVLVPLKALAAEIAHDWSAGLPGKVVEAYTSDRTRTRPYRRADVLVMTPERLDLLFRAPHRHPWLRDLRRVIVDELHLLADPHRGHRLDAALTRLRLHAPQALVTGLTATCGNPGEVLDWLRGGDAGQHLHAAHRPVPLHWTTVTVRDAREKREALIAALQDHGTPALVFVHARARTTELATFLAEHGYAAAAHHAALPEADRTQAERDFREGRTQVLVCTPTLTTGVNLPVRHAVLYDLTHHASDGVLRTRTPLSVNDAWQRAGRAGRDARTPGHVTVLGTRDEHPERYESAVLDDLRSPLASPAFMLDFLLGTLDAGDARTWAQAERALHRTFAYQGAHDPEHLEVTKALMALWNAGAITTGEEGSGGGPLRVTPLGRVASRHLLDPRTVAAADQLPADPTAFDVLLHAAQALPSRPDVQDHWYALIVTARDHLPSRELDAGVVFPYGVPSAALMLLDACTDGDEAAAATFGIAAYDIRALRDGAARTVQAWAQYRPDVLKLRLVSVMLTAGVDLPGSTLALLPGVGATRARSLQRAGIPDLEALAVLAPGPLTVPGLSDLQLTTLVDAAQTKVGALDTDPTREPPPHPDRQRGLDAQVPDPLRLTRALTLTVYQTAPEQYAVRDGSEPRTVTRTPHGWTCTCPDLRPWRACKHVLAAQLHAGDPAVTRARHALQAAQDE